MDKQIEDYLKSERQWTRQCRIDRARLELANCAHVWPLEPDTSKRFWHEVIFRLTGSER